MATTAHTMRIVTGLTLRFAFIFMGLTIILTCALIKWNPQKRRCNDSKYLAWILPPIMGLFLGAQGNYTLFLKDPSGTQIKQNSTKKRAKSPEHR